jgi:hypothetical protein
MNRVPKGRHNPSVYVSNHVHIVFSTKNRLKAIPENLQPKLWAYMAGIAKTIACTRSPSVASIP